MAFTGYLTIELVCRKKRNEVDENEQRHRAESLPDKIATLQDIRSLIAHVNSDKLNLPSGTHEWSLLEQIQRSLERLFTRVQHKLGVSDEDAPR